MPYLKRVTEFLVLLIHVLFASLRISTSCWRLNSIEITDYMLAYLHGGRQLVILTLLTLTLPCRVSPSPSHVTRLYRQIPTLLFLQVRSYH